MDSTQQAWWKTPVYIVSFVVLSVFCLADAFFARNAVLSFLTWNQARTISAQQAQGISPNQFQLASVVESIDKLVLLILGCTAVGVVIWIEYRLRKVAKEGNLLRQIAIIAIVELVIAAVAFVVQIVLV